MLGWVSDLAWSTHKKSFTEAKERKVLQEAERPGYVQTVEKCKKLENKSRFVNKS